MTADHEIKRAVQLAAPDQRLGRAYAAQSGEAEEIAPVVLAPTFRREPLARVRTGAKARDRLVDIRRFCRHSHISAYFNPSRSSNRGSGVPGAPIYLFTIARPRLRDTAGRHEQLPHARGVLPPRDHSSPFWTASRQRRGDAKRLRRAHFTSGADACLCARSRPQLPPDPPRADAMDHVRAWVRLLLAFRPRAQLLASDDREPDADRGARQYLLCRAPYDPEFLWRPISRPWDSDRPGGFLSRPLNARHPRRLDLFIRIRRQFQDDHSQDLPLRAFPGICAGAHLNTFRIPSLVGRTSEAARRDADPARAGFGRISAPPQRGAR